MTRAMLLIVACTSLACTSIQTPTGLKASTFGSGSMNVTVLKDGSAEIQAQSDGTNIFRVFDGLFKAAGGVFGADPSTDIHITMPPAAGVLPEVVIGDDAENTD